MINGVSDALRLAGQLSPVNQTIKPLAPQELPAALPQIALGQFRSVAFERWAKMTTAQHRISSAQVANQAIGALQMLLRQMLKQIPAAIAQQNEAQTQLAVLREQLCQLNPSYLGIPLLDYQLNLRIQQRRSAKRRFRLRAINLLSSKSREEQLTFHIPTANGPEIICVRLSAHATEAELLIQLNRALQPIGITIEFGKDNQAELSCDDALWQLMTGSITMSGQGQRLPAGDARQIQLDELQQWQDPYEWDLHTIEGLNQTRLKIQKTQRKLELQQRQTREQLRQLQHMLRQQPALPDETVLIRLHNQLHQGPFNTQLSALLAQANLGRNQASDLLK